MDRGSAIRLLFGQPTLWITCVDSGLASQALLTYASSSVHVSNGRWMKNATPDRKSAAVGTAGEYFLARCADHDGCESACLLLAEDAQPASK
jgi:hypothetical protein